MAVLSEEMVAEIRAAADAYTRVQLERLTRANASQIVHAAADPAKPAPRRGRGR